ncbi:MAG: hypothetical protein LBK52_02490 [Deltaproteobacteria bacterium]|jgi:hypothetical protein|nr:hypothetical protein [Deltaproteobacteria bacterium]
MNYCSHCGAKLNNKLFNFCPKCGQSLPAPLPESLPSQQPSGSSKKQETEPAKGLGCLFWVILIFSLPFTKAIVYDGIGLGGFVGGFLYMSISYALASFISSLFKKK